MNDTVTVQFRIPPEIRKAFNLVCFEAGETQEVVFMDLIKTSFPRHYARALLLCAAEHADTGTHEKNSTGATSASGKPRKRVALKATR